MQLLKVWPLVWPNALTEKVTNGYIMVLVTNITKLPPLNCMQSHNDYNFMNPLVSSSTVVFVSRPMIVLATSNTCYDLAPGADFLSRVQHLKIRGSNNTLGTSSIHVNNQPFSLSPFKELKSLWVRITVVLMVL